MYHDITMFNAYMLRVVWVPNDALMCIYYLFLSSAVTGILYSSLKLLLLSLIHYRALLLYEVWLWIMHLDETRHRNKTFSPERLEQKSQKTTVCFQCFDILLQIIH